MMMYHKNRGWKWDSQVDVEQNDNELQKSYRPKQN